VIPGTFGDLLAFLLLIAPGIVYRIVRDRFFPQRQESAFTEISRVAITSLLFSVMAFGIMWLLKERTKLALPDLNAWFDEGAKYAASNLLRVVVGLCGQLVIACGFAAVYAWLTTPIAAARYRNNTILGSVLRRYVPSGYFPWLHIVLDDGTEFWGYERAHDDREDVGPRAVVLAGSTLMRRLPGESSRVPIGDDWDVVVIESEHIRYMRVTYLNHEGSTARAVVRTRRRRWIRPLRGRRATDHQSGTTT
jgi:hypothetical protein